VAAMGATHAALRGVEMGLSVPVAGPAGEPLPVRLHLRDAAPAPWWTPLKLGRHAIALQWHRDDSDPVYTDLAAGGLQEVELTWTPPTRGEHPLPDVTVSTRFPLGLFRAWALWRPVATALVWPRPEQNPPPWPEASNPSSEAAQQTRKTAAPPEELEPEGVRPWRRGDRPREVHWKLSARLLAHDGPLLVREQAPSTADRRIAHLRWNDTPLQMAPEARLSRLCAWVHQAHHLQRPWTLELPGDGVRPPSADAALRVPSPASALQADLRRLAECFGPRPEDVS